MSQPYQLGDADEMFRRFMDRWYNDESRELKGFKATRPDMMTQDNWVGQQAPQMNVFNDETCAMILKQILTMLEAARNDWKTYLPVKDPIDLSWVKAFDEYYDLARVEALAARCDPTDYSNDYLIIVIEFGAVLGHVMTTLLPRLEWVAGWPYWESALFDSTTGELIPVFHWAIKKFSTYGIDDGFAEKIEATVRLERGYEPGEEGVKGMIMGY